jgi:tRNA-uridine 2-sulfurtransferase
MMETPRRCALAPAALLPLASSPSATTGAPAASAAAPAAAAIGRLRGWPGEHRVAVGLSGGVDSSLTAALLLEAGWQVEGLTLWLMSGKGACCAEGLVDAAGICEQLDIPHHVVDSRARFEEQIVGFLVEGYAAGVTPLPCSRCNREVKFSPMLEWAQRERGITRIATGHYARLRHAPESVGRTQLLRGLDARKDQSYFLYDLPQHVLSRLVFPLGELTKADTRLEAERYGLRTAKKPESQDLCLADHHGSMKAFLDAYLSPRQGEIVLSDGRVLGQHDGIEHFTIGQRKGLGVAWSEPLHVVRLDAAMNRVVVAPRAEAGRGGCVVGPSTGCRSIRSRRRWISTCRCATAALRWRPGSRPWPLPPPTRPLVGPAVPAWNSLRSSFRSPPARRRCSTPGRCCWAAA